MAIITKKLMFQVREESFLAGLSQKISKKSELKI